MMATATTSSLSLSTSSALNVASRQSPSASPQCVSLPTLPPPPVQSQSRVSRTSAYCLKIARNVKAMATGDGPAAATVSVTEPASTPAPTPTPASTEVDDGETPEFLKTVQQAWDKVEDKYAVSSLAVAGTLALVASSGVISAIDKLPLIPGVLELVGIGYTGWFAYKNLIFTPEREALIKKVKDTYNEIIGSS